MLYKILSIIITTLVAIYDVTIFLLDFVYQIALMLLVTMLVVPYLLEQPNTELLGLLVILAVIYKSLVLLLEMADKYINIDRNKPYISYIRYKGVVIKRYIYFRPFKVIYENTLGIYSKNKELIYKKKREFEERCANYTGENK